MSFVSSLGDAPGHLMGGMGELGQAAGSHFGGLMHGAGDVMGGFAHGAGDMASGVGHGVMDAAHDVADGAHHAWEDASHGHFGAALGDLAGGAMNGMMHAGSDIGHGLMDGLGHIGGGLMHGAQDFIGGEKGMLSHLLAGGKELGKGIAPLAKAFSVGKGLFGGAKGAWDLMHGKTSFKDFEKVGEGGLKAMKELFGGDKDKDGKEGQGGEGGHGKEEEKDGVDKAVGMAKTGVGGLKSLISLPEKFSNITNTIGKVITEGVPGAGMIEKLSGGVLKESMIAEKAGSVLKPLHGFLEKGGEKLLAGPLGNLLEKEAVAGGSKIVGKYAGKILPGLNMATAALSAFESGKSAYQSFKKGDIGGAVIEGFHTLTNIAGGLPIPGAGLIGLGGDLVSGAAHWLKDGGAKKIGEFATSAVSSVGGAIGSAVKAVGDSPVGQFAKGAAKTVGNMASGAGKAIGNLASGAKKLFSGW